MDLDISNNNNDLLTCITELLKKTSLKNLANELNIATGTIIRWIELKNVPKQYEFNILK